SDFTATIDWGDGTTSTGTVSLGTNSGGAGTPVEMVVTGTHTYTPDVKDGTLSIRVTIFEGDTVVAVGPAYVNISSDPGSPAPPPITVAPPPVSTPLPVNPGGPMIPAPQPSGPGSTPVDSPGNEQVGPIALNVPPGPTAFTNAADSLFSSRFESHSSG